MSSLLKLRRGSTVAHETFTGADGEVTFNTDTNALVTHDGITAGGFPHVKSAELAASGGSALVGYLPAGSGAVATTVQSKLSESVSVLDFMTAAEVAGCVDGSVDVTDAIQAAFDSLSAYGGEVHFPKGIYLISSTLTTPTNRRLHLIGQGNTSTNASGSITEIRKAASLNGAALYITGTASTVEKMAFQGVVGNGGDGIQITASRVTLRDVSVFLMGNDGIRIGEDTGGVNCNLWYLDNVKTKSNTRHGLMVSEGPGAVADSNAGTCMHIDTQSNGDCGVYLGGTQLNTFVGGGYQNNSYGIRFGPAASYNQVFGGDFEASVSGNNIRIDNGAVYNSIFTNTVLYATSSVSASTDNNRIECIDCIPLVEPVS